MMKVGRKEVRGHKAEGSRGGGRARSTAAGRPTGAGGPRPTGAAQRQKAQALSEDPRCGMGARAGNGSLVTPDASSRGVPGADARLQWTETSWKTGLGQGGEGEEDR